MIRDKLIWLKPGGKRRSHLLLAAALWTGVGLMLMVRGLSFLNASGWLILVLPAVLLGALKSRYILDKTARKTINRILLFKDGTCLGAVYSIKTWLLVAVMMTTGVILRHSPIPAQVLGCLYCTVGWSLFWSSRLGWRVWRS